MVWVVFSLLTCTIGAAALPETSVGVHPYAVIYNPSYDISERREFIAEAFDVAIVGYTETLAELFHVHNASLPVLAYSSITDMRPTYPDWEVCDAVEPMFLHGTDPGSLTLLPSAEGITLHWRRDARTKLSIQGYNAYRSSSRSDWAKINSSLLAVTSFCDRNVVDDRSYAYLIRSASMDGTEHDFSGIKEARPSSVRSRLVLAASDFNADTLRLGNGLALYLCFEVSCTGKPDRTDLCIDINNDWCFSDKEEVRPMSTIGDGVYRCTVDVEVDVGYQGGFGYHFEFGDSSGIVRLPEDGSNYTTSLNNRIRSPGGSYKMDVANEHWQGHYVRRARSMLADGYDGMFADNAVVRLNHHQNWADSRPQAYSKTRWAGQMKDALSSVKSGLGSALVVFNGLGLEDADQLLEVADGGMIEGFAHYSWLGGGYYSEDEWKRQMNIAIRAAREPSKAVFLLSNGNEEDVQARLFSLASYLMAKGNRSYYCYAEKYQYLEYFPEYELGIGQPVDLGSSIDDYYDLKNDVYRRRFTNGLVLISPSSAETTKEISLQQTLHRVILSGGTVFNGGTISYDRVRLVSLPLHSGAILLEDTDSGGY